jgi:Globin
MVVYTVHACAAVGRHTAATHTHAAVSDQSLNITFTTFDRCTTVALPLGYTQMGMAFYETFFIHYPQYVPLFGRANMDSLSSHLFEALGVVTKSFAKFEAAFPILHNLGKMHVGYGIPSEAYEGFRSEYCYTYILYTHTLQVYCIS